MNEVAGLEPGVLIGFDGLCARFSGSLRLSFSGASFELRFGGDIDVHRDMMIAAQPYRYRIDAKGLDRID